ncbi:hypothetical protein [uncultured Acetobacteroides sp.]|uniref:hypothetical protein n=1 Tax=uncultured Acetobacteroides sp. TaxID=1760811 RepID=UPI0029F532B9|nr:hypothetical protein [uncultured Acetobacteroides sp.]
MITRKNYEEYFLDYFDGNLSDELVEGLLRFLAANPDLEEEFYLLMEQTADCNITSEDFSSILVKRDPKIGYELSSFDYLCVAELEHDITPPEKVILDESIAANAKLKVDFDLFQQTKLEEEKVICPFKDELKKNVFKSGLKRNLVAYSGIAAAVLLVFYFTIHEEQVKELSNNAAPKMVVAPQNTNDAIRQATSTSKPINGEQLAQQSNDRRSTTSSIQKINGGTNSSSANQDSAVVVREHSEIAYIASVGEARVVQEHGDHLASLSIKPDQAASAKTADGSSSNKEIATNLAAFLEKAKTESETISQKISDAKGRRKGVFIARAISSLNSIFGTNIEYSSKYDADGNLVAMNIEAGYLKYSKKNDGLK